MAVAGHVHKITDHKKFFSAALLNDKKLMEKSSEPVGPVEVELITRFPLPPSVLSLPPISFSQDQSSTDGQFIFNHPELTPAMEKQATLQLVVRKLLFPPQFPADFGWGAPIKVFDSLYRSAEFKWSDADGKSTDIFVALDTTPDDKAVTQDTVDGAISSILKVMNADPKLDPNVRPVRGFGVIGSDGVHMHLSTGSGNATTISDFRLCLVSSEAPDLSQFFNPYIVDFSSQHPCVVSVDTVKTRLQLGVDHSIGALNATIHKELVDDLAHASGRQQSIVQSFFDSFISTTFRRVRYPKIGEHVAKLPGGFTLGSPVFGIAPDPCFGFPRVLFGS